MPSLRPRMPLLAMTWVLRQCQLCTPLHANGSPGPGTGGATRLCCMVLHPGAQPAQTSVGEDFRSSIAAGSTPPIRRKPRNTSGYTGFRRSRPSTCVFQRRQTTLRYARALGSDLLDLDLDVDAGGEIEALEGLDGLRRGLDNVDQALVDAHLEVLAGVLVDVR